MKNKILSTTIYVLILLIFLAFNSFSQNIPYGNAGNTDNEKIEWLKRSALRIKSTDPNDEDYSDLKQLKDKIGDSRIVMLGEQSHGDGTTFLMKTRLIEFLIKEMGFDVILFESGLFDCRKIDEFIKNGEPVLQSIRKGVFPIWNLSEQFQPLINFIDKHKKNLNIGGFDCQFTGEASKEYFLHDFENYLKSKNIDTNNYSNWINIRTILKDISQERYIMPQPLPPTLDLQTNFINRIQQIIASLRALSNDTTPSDTEFWIQMLESSVQQAKSIWQSYGVKDFSTIPIETRNIRDIQMGKNLIWQANVNYPSKKIIVWAATYHIARNLEKVEVIGSPNMYDGTVTMGDIAWKSLGNQLYTIGFTAYEGDVGWANNQYKRTLEKPDPNSLEGLLFKTGYDNCFLDLSNLNNSGKWLQQKIISRPLGYANMNSDWSQNMDGIIFTKNMIPSKKASE